MQIPGRIVGGVSAVVVIQTVALIRRSKQLTRAKKGIELTLLVNDVLGKESAQLRDEMTYLVHILNDNNVTLDEFDLIALPSIKTKEED